MLKSEPLKITYQRIPKSCLFNSQNTLRNAAWAYGLWAYGLWAWAYGLMAYGLGPMGLNLRVWAYGLEPKGLGLWAMGYGLGLMTKALPC